MEPDSNQPSSTSGVRFIVPPEPHLYWMASRNSLWRSLTAWPARCSISAIDPRTSLFLHAEHSHTGIVVAQYQLREMFQSRAFCNHFPNRPSLIVSGYHSISLL